MSARIPEPLCLPPFNIAAVDEARALAARAERLHREADAIVVPFSLVAGEDRITRVVYDTESHEARRAASLRRVACALEADAEQLVPVEYRG